MITPTLETVLTIGGVAAAGVAIGRLWAMARGPWVKLREEVDHLKEVTGRHQRVLATPDPGSRSFADRIAAVEGGLVMLTARVAQMAHEMSSQSTTQGEHLAQIRDDLHQLLQKG